MICSDRPDRDRSNRTASGTVVGGPLLAEDERIIVGDLGLARDLLAGEGAASVIGGSPHYQSPEQLVATAGVTSATDIYALTAILWRLLGGGDPPDARDVTTDLLVRFEPRWRDLFHRGLAVEPESRFDSVTEWRDAALAALGGTSAVVDVGGPDAGVTIDRCPYRGLASYQLADAADYFGREALVAALLDRLRDQRTLVVAGPSGSGKSSVVRAGLLRALGAGALPASDRWPVALMTPGADPIAELQYQLMRLAAGQLVRLPEGAEARRGAPPTARPATNDADRDRIA